MTFVCLDIFSWLSVLAVLTIEFARTIALALTIGDFVMKFMNRWVAPIIMKATPKDYRVSLIFFNHDI
jgi:hypothetical protein